MTRSAARQKRKGALRLMSITSSSMASSVSCTGAHLPDPALLTRQSSLPKDFIASSTACTGAFAAVTSAART